MSTVKSVIKNVHQPKNGLLPIEVFEKVQLKDASQMTSINSNIKSLIDLAVEYLTRFLLKKDIESAFETSFKGAMLVGEEKKARELSRKITGLDDQTIIAALDLVAYNVAVTDSIVNYHPINSADIDYNTLRAIKVMVTRAYTFLTRYGSKVIYNHSLEGGYSDTITDGNVPFVTVESILMLSFGEHDPTIEETLELLTYYVMATKSIYPNLHTLKYVSFFNPLTNTFYKCNTPLISSTAIEIVDTKILAYGVGDYNVKTEIPDFLSFTETMEYLNISEDKLAKLIKNRQLVSTLYHGDEKIAKITVENYLKNKRLTNKLIWILSLSTVAAVVILVVVLLVLK